MQILKTLEDLKHFKATLPINHSLGFVPTMGALHKGHQSLIEQSCKQNTHTLVSIFVNPTQFGINEDFNQYPRTLEQDCDLCASLGVDAVFAPQIHQIYPQEDSITLNPPKSMGYVFEGFVREGHFDGVLQIVIKLFNLTGAHFAYFGKKDAQQLLLIKRLVQDLFIPIQIVACQTIRDADGLALSSRNIYLSAKERQIALQIPHALMHIEKRILQGEKDCALLLQEAKEQIPDVLLDYFAITNHHLTLLDHIEPQNSIVLIAGRVGKTRLLDNLWL